LLKSLIFEKKQSLKSAVMQASLQTGISRGEIYEIALQIKNESN
jgi:hypothetical protein